MSQTDHEGYEILDKSYDRESGELLSFLLLTEGGEPELKKATPENTLLYIHGLYEFLNGNEGVVLSEDDPTIMIAPTGGEQSFLLNVGGNVVETTPANAKDVLEGVKQAVEHGKTSKIEDVHQEIVDSQVRRDVISPLIRTFDEDERKRIEEHSNGWLIDEFFLVTWEANLYARDDDADSDDYQRGGGGVVETDRSFELVQLRGARDLDSVTVSIGGRSIELSEREMLFLTKVKWTLHRRKYHPDTPFWDYIDNYAERKGIVTPDEIEEDDGFVPDFG